MSTNGDAFFFFYLNDMGQPHSFIEVTNEWSRYTACILGYVCDKDERLYG